MKVLFLTTHLNAGGITSYLLTLSKQLRNRGIDVHVLSCGGELENEFTLIQSQLKNINFRTKSEIDPRIYLSLNHLKKYILLNKIDILHAQTRVTQVMAQCLKSLTNKPFVSTCHGFFKVRLSRRIFPCWGDQTIAISKPVYNHLHQDFKISEERISLIPNGIDIEQFPIIPLSKKEEAQKKLNILGFPIFGHIGRLSSVKGQDILIKAMPSVIEQFPEAKLIIAGVGKEEIFLKEITSQLRLEKSVLFYPIVNRVFDTLCLFDIFVMPSRQEGLGLSVMEAQSCGLPVIATNVGGLKDIVIHGENGYLVEPENPATLANQMIAAAKNIEASRKMGIVARRMIENAYSSTIMADKTLIVYEKALKESKCRKY